jgi:hypothetical protein
MSNNSEEAEMKKFVTSSSVLVLGILAAVFLAACGGGGGGGGTPSLSYTGSTAQAAITNSNAETLLKGAYEGGEETSFVITMGTDTSSPGGYSLPLELVRKLTGAVADVAGGTVGTLSTSISQPPVDGNCGGSMTESGSMNDAGTRVSGTITYSNYCEDDGTYQTTMNGSVSFSMEVDNPDSPTSMSMTMNTSSLKMTVKESGTGTVVSSDTMGGSISATINLSAGVPTGITATMNAVLRDDGTGKTYKVENYSMDMTDDGLGTTTVTVTGRYYDYDYGYVNVSAPSLVVVSDNPTSGQLTITGAVTVTDNSNSKAYIDFGTDNLYVDANGDGSYETSKTITW